MALTLKEWDKWVTHCEAMWVVLAVRVCSTNILFRDLRFCWGIKIFPSQLWPVIRWTQLFPTVVEQISKSSSPWEKKKRAKKHGVLSKPQNAECGVRWTVVQPYDSGLPARHNPCQFFFFKCPNFYLFIFIFIYLFLFMYLLFYFIFVFCF